jgi:beta-phosphoglucomutase-like phosphatase (HAD superfamily)
MAFLFDLDGTLIDSVYQHVLGEEKSVRNQYRSDRRRNRIRQETVVDDCMAADREQCQMGRLFPVLQRT